MTNVFQRLIMRYPLVLTKQRRSLFLSPCYLKDPKDDASAKLHDLLQSIIKDDNLEKDTKITSFETVARKKKPPREKSKDLGKRIVESAEAVSKTLPGKPELTEAQLLHKLLYKDKSLTENILKATSGKDLLNDLLSQMPVEQAKPKIPKTKVKDVEYSRATKVRDVLGRKEYVIHQKSAIPGEKVDFDSEGTLGIFTPGVAPAEEAVKMGTWEALRNRNLRLLITHPPRNIYEQMISWTESGILWKFPINNEIGLEEEENTDFTEHVFLENQIEDWCPEQGPIRHFMELVCVGLSRNYYLTAREKKDHILWYKDFFTGKKDLIRELGAGEIREAQQIQ